LPVHERTGEIASTIPSRRRVTEKKMCAISLIFFCSFEREPFTDRFSSIKIHNHRLHPALFVAFVYQLRVLISVEGNSFPCQQRTDYLLRTGCPAVVLLNPSDIPTYAGLFHFNLLHPFPGPLSF